MRTAGLTAIISGAGAVVGLGLDAMILFRYGAGDQTDAFFAALILPTLVIGIISIQGPKILIPTFTSMFNRADVEGFDLLHNVLTVASVLLGALVVATWALAGLLIPLQAPGLDVVAIVLAVRLNRILVAQIWFQGLAAVLQAILFARHSYVVSSASKIVVNGATLAAVWLSGAADIGVEVVAWGMVFGSAVYLGMLLTVLYAHGYRYRWTFTPSDPRMRNVFGSFGYPLVGHLLGESGSIVQSAVASFLGSGSLTLLHYASRILGALGGILLGSVVQVTMPTISGQVASNDLTGQRRTLLEAIQILSLVAAPLSLWLVIMAEPLVTVLFQRGQFGPAHAQTVAAVVRAMIVHFFLTRFVSVTQTWFYANADTRTPFVSTSIFTIANIVFAVPMGYWFQERGLGVAVSAASICNTIYMLRTLNVRLGPVGWKDLYPFAVRLGASTALASLGFIVALKVATGFASTRFVDELLTVSISSAAGFGLFVVAAIGCGLLETMTMAPRPTLRE